MIQDSPLRVEPQIRLPVTSQAKLQARLFAQAHATPAKRRAVYFNTLAVLLVNDYFQMMAIETDLEQSDSWHWFWQRITDVADLSTEFGVIECRLMNQNQQFSLPEALPQNPVAMIGIELDLETETGIILGFSPQLHPPVCSLQDLQEIDQLFDYLETLQPALPSPSLLGRLSQWLQTLVNQSWQSLETLLQAPSLNLSRSQSPEMESFNLSLADLTLEEPEALAEMSPLEKLEEELTDGGELPFPPMAAQARMSAMPPAPRKKMKSESQTETLSEDKSLSIEPIEQGKKIHLNHHSYLLKIQIFTADDQLQQVKFILQCEDSLFPLPSGLEMLILNSDSEIQQTVKVEDETTSQLELPLLALNASRFTLQITEGDRIYQEQFNLE